MKKVLILILSLFLLASCASKDAQIKTNNPFIKENVTYNVIVIDKDSGDQIATHTVEGKGIVHSEYYDDSKSNVTLIMGNNTKVYLTNKYCLTVIDDSGHFIIQF